MSRVSKMTKPIAHALFRRGVTWAVFKRDYNFYYRISSKTWYKLRRLWTEELSANGGDGQKSSSGSTIAPSEGSIVALNHVPDVSLAVQPDQFDISRVIGLVCRIVPAAVNDWDWEAAYACATPYRAAFPRATEEQVANFIIQNYSANSAQPVSRHRKATLVASTRRSGQLVLRLEGIDTVKITYE